ncbi:MAG: histidine phosphatase family protein [Anaerolineae bacterium]|nr:histidine phosphatase family protein [Anaerolineae bacterium]
MDEKTTVYLVRHGETDSNVEGLLAGQSQDPLNELGHRQAEFAAARLAQVGLRAIYSSDLPRAMQTAQAIAAVTGLMVQPDVRLREIYFGEWEMRRAADIVKEDPKRLRAFFSDPYHVRTPGGESFGDQHRRAQAALDDIAGAHPGQSVALVAHGGILITLLIGIYNDKTFVMREFANGSVTVLRGAPGAWEVVLLNDTSHLDHLGEQGGYKWNRF